MKQLSAIKITYSGGRVEIFRRRRYTSSWIRKDENLVVPDDGGKYVQIRPKLTFDAHDPPIPSGYPIPAVVHKGVGLDTKYNGTEYNYVPLEDRWQWFLYGFLDWASGYILPRGQKIGTHVNPKNPAIVYDDYTPGSLLSLYSQIIMDAKSHTDSASPETGARDVVTGRNMSNRKPYEWLCRPTCGALLRVTGFGSYWKAEAIDLLKPCPDVDFLAQHLYFWATQVSHLGSVTRYPDVKREFEFHGIPPAGTPLPLFSLGGNFLIRKSSCIELSPGQPWSPYA